MHIFIYIAWGATSACFDPDPDLLNDNKYLKDNNCESFCVWEKARLSRQPLFTAMSGYLEREISVSNAINFRSDWGPRTNVQYLANSFLPNTF